MYKKTKTEKKGRKKEESHLNVNLFFYQIKQKKK